MSWEILQGDCVEAMRQMDEASVDAIVTDPPYGLEFMGKEWDRLGAGLEDFAASDYGSADGNTFGQPGGQHVRYGKSAKTMQQWHQAWATEAFRVLKPGGHLLAFGGTRTYHRLACAVEDAGFEIRDSVIWLYGSGFPKSLDVGKAIDKAAGAEREVIGVKHGEKYPNGPGGNTFTVAGDPDGSRDEPQPLTAPATPEAAQWDGWGTALAPGHEPIVVARKPLTGTVASNVLQWGTGAINIDGSRVSSEPSRRMDGCQSNGSAPHAERISEWHPLESSEAKEPIALALAAIQPEGEPVLLIRTGAGGASSVQMATSPSVTRAITSLSIESSWSESLDASSNGTSMSITETATALTTDSGILNFCRSLTTLPTITQDATPPAGCKCDVLPVVESLSEDGLKWSDTPLRIAAAPVTASGRWPKNVVLSHLPECEQVGTRRVKGSNIGGDVTAMGQHGIYGKGKALGRKALTYADPDGTEQVAAWRCAESCPVAALDEQSGELSGGQYPEQRGEGVATGFGRGLPTEGGARAMGDSGGASRFYYTAKASRADNSGLSGAVEQVSPAAQQADAEGGPAESEPRFRYVAKASRSERNAGLDGNHHPTVKPIALMRWLVRLVCPVGGTVLDPFAGSGTTGIAAVLEGFDFIGIEREAEYCAIARARIQHWASQPVQMGLEL